jgi:hypothetical protein
VLVRARVRVAAISPDGACRFRGAAVKAAASRVDGFHVMGEASPGEPRSRYGLLASAFGAILLAVSVFLPWYGVSITSDGIALAEQAGERIAAEFGNAALQSHLGALHSSLGGLADHELFALSAHQALSTLNVLLLILAGLGILITLLALAGPPSASTDANRVPLALLGLVGAACVVFRMVDPPSPAGALLSLSLREGAWVALLGCVCMTVGAVWSPGATAKSGMHEGADVWAELSGWTPET